MVNSYSKYNGHRRIWAVILLILLLSAWPLPVYAAGGDGTGPGVNGVFKHDKRMKNIINKKQKAW